MKRKADKPNDSVETAEIARTLELNPSPGRFADWRRWKFVIVALGVLAVIAIAVLLWKGSDTSGTVRYEIQEVKRGNLTVIVTATGTLQPTNSVEVGSELSGTVRIVEVDYNDRVKVGQILARLDTTKLEATITQHRAALEAEKAKVLQADATVAETRAKLAQYQRVRELSKGKVPSQTEMDAAEAAFARAQANAANCRAAVSQAQATLSVSETDRSQWPGRWRPAAAALPTVRRGYGSPIPSIPPCTGPAGRASAARQPGCRDRSAATPHFPVPRCGSGD